MQIIVCVDDNMGMLFNKRRQSRDQAVIRDILSYGNDLWIHSFSQKLFEGNEEAVIVDDSFLQKAGNQQLCFVENESLQPYLNKIERIILYRWNRKYPFDFQFDIDLNEWEMVEQKEFRGNSHETITREIYIRRI